jgi:hypothetical protein
MLVISKLLTHVFENITMSLQQLYHQILWGKQQFNTKPCHYNSYTTKYYEENNNLTQTKIWHGRCIEVSNLGDREYVLTQKKVSLR